MGSEIEWIGFSVQTYGGKALRSKRELFLFRNRRTSVGSRKYYKLLIYIYLLLPTYFLLPMATGSGLGSRKFLGIIFPLYFKDLIYFLLPRRILQYFLNENDSRLAMYSGTKVRR